MPRRLPLILSFVLMLALIGPALGTEAATASMAALGDSITRAYNTGPSAYRDYAANSWSTGSSTTVNTHAVRLGIPGSAFNYAVSGAKMADLKGQTDAVNGPQVGYVTILMGGNDVCTRSVATMTEPDLFATDFQAAMDNLATRSPNALVYVVSIPNPYRLWDIYHTSSTARFYWSFFRICQSLLAKASSTLSTDEARRRSVETRTRDLNAKLELICGEYAKAAAAQLRSGTCLFDGNVVFNFQFQRADVSTRDYFHPSATGQRRLACATWNVGYWKPAMPPDCNL